MRKPPNVLLRAAVGWQAGRIADPIDRLRFLRHTLGDRCVWDPRSEVGRAFFHRRRASMLVALSALLLLPAGTMTSASRLWKRGPIVVAQAGNTGPETLPNVWQVESNAGFETYSNGLRIERRYEVANETRKYRIYRRGFEDAGPAGERTDPSGIVFHTTESNQPEFTENKTKAIRRVGATLLSYLQQEHAYHYMVDRFGNVWRVVRESDSANHSGYSVWADNKFTYVNLNRAFLGVSVETVTQPGEAKAQATPAQIHALRVLTEMLRAKYKISAADCATHAQVSVNPDNMQVGYHYDWASNFPYVAVGLPDNYSVPAPGLWIFGFTYDPALVEVTGQAFWRGLLLGEDQLRQNATAHGLSVAAYRKELEKRYRQVLSEMKTKAELSKENKG
ncbi:peptidoglycan recognition family protein [uncultured Paludibaculum sp.]|uniref:peptidoglycan recognition protein family protein n=1 Tax=uncultured Paludibaculum sp. TaxID=1765020 RepID=UPI002AAB1D29|nr:peptidoglycan recognition family protein [uncultured Paludibaculum sp.]